MINGTTLEQQLMEHKSRCAFLHDSMYNAWNNRNDIETTMIAKTALLEIIGFVTEALHIVSASESCISDEVRALLETLANEIYNCESSYDEREYDTEHRKELRTKLVDLEKCLRKDKDKGSVVTSAEQPKGEDRDKASNATFALREIGKYYYIFKSTIEENVRPACNKQARSVEERIGQIIDGFVRAISYASKAIEKCPKDVDARLFIARLYRRLGYEYALSGELQNSFSSYMKAVMNILYGLAFTWKDNEEKKNRNFGKADGNFINVIELNVVDKEDSQLEPWDLGNLHWRLRAINDLSRIIESWALGLERGRHNSEKGEYYEALGDMKNKLNILLKSPHDYISDIEEKYREKIRSCVMEPISSDLTQKAASEQINGRNIEYAIDVALELQNHVEKFCLINRMNKEQLKDLRVYVTLHNKARLLLMKGKKEEARKYYKQALSLNGEYAPAQENLGLLMLKDGVLEEAYERLERAREIYNAHNNLRREALDVNLGKIFIDSKRRREELLKYLNIKRTLPGEGDNGLSADKLIVIRRYNSFTPYLPNKEKELGGGYFFVLNGLGFAVDPGYGFLESLNMLRYSLSDIDIILVSHLHSDHTFQLEEMFMLLYEGYKRLGKVKEIVIAGKEDVIHLLQARFEALAFSRDFAKHIKWKTIMSEVEFQKREKENIKKCKDNGLRVYATKAIHMPYGEEREDDGVRKYLASGFLIMNEWKNYTIGYTGDTAFCEDLCEVYKKCDVLILHLGDLGIEDFDYFGEIIENREKLNDNHLGLYGVYRILMSVDNSKQVACILSEFGEELGVHRVEITRKLNERLLSRRKNVYCITGDIGFQMYISRKEDRLEITCPCRFCGGSEQRPFVEMKEILGKELSGGKIVYHCARHLPEMLLERL